MTDKKRYLFGVVCVLAAAVAWSTSGVFTIAISADTWTMLFWRGAFGSVALVMMIGLMPTTAGGLSAFRRLGRWECLYAAVTSLSMIIFVSSMRMTSVAHVAVIIALTPFMAAYFAWVVLREKPHSAAILASAMAFAGVLIMVGMGRDGTWWGDLFALGVPATMGAMILISRKAPDMPGLQTTCVASLLTAIATAPIAQLSDVSTRDLLLLFAFGFVNQAVGFGLFAVGARHLPSMESALITALDAPLTPIWVWLVFSIAPPLFTIFGGAIVFFAVIGNILWSNRQRMSG
jgi:drug/metabolite transporter (DMT)-like permease